jgi:hypothetical protein
MTLGQPCSYTWRGPRGSGKRTKLLDFLKVESDKICIPFKIKTGTWYLNKQVSNADPDDDDDDGGTGKSIPYEESHIHLGFDVARMSMSDKVFLQSILTRWTGQQDVCLSGFSKYIGSRYLVLYHAQHLTDESVLQLQECLEQYPTFAILLTSELPMCGRLRDFCMEIPVKGRDQLMTNYSKSAILPENDVWLEYFKKTLEEWATTKPEKCIVLIRNWIYVCLQRNLRWTDVIMYWIEAIHDTSWITNEIRHKLLGILSLAESGSGWVLVSSYRIPILWEHVHLQFAKNLYDARTLQDNNPKLQS